MRAVEGSPVNKHFIDVGMVEATKKEKVVAVPEDGDVEMKTDEEAKEEEQKEVVDPVTQAINGLWSTRCKWESGIDSFQKSRTISSTLSRAS